MSTTLLSILVVLNNAVVRMVSTCALISKISSSIKKPLRIIPSPPNTNLIITTFVFNSFFKNSLTRSRYLSLFSVSFMFTFRCKGRQSQLFGSFFCSLSWGRFVRPRFGDPFVSQSQKEVCVSLSPRRILCRVYITSSYGQTETFCTTISRSLFPLSRVYSYTLLAFICCIRLLNDWSIRLYRHIIFIVTSCLFLF